MVRTSNRKRRNASLQLPTVKPGKAVRGSAGSLMSKQQATSEARYAHALVNPWASEARGCKVPDSDSSRSVAFTTKSIYPVNTSASGSAVVAVKPDLQNPFMIGTYNGGTGLWDYAEDSDNPDYAAMASTFKSARIVSYGVRVYMVTNFNDCGGTIRCITLSDIPSAIGPTGSLFEEIVEHRVANADVHWHAKPVGNQYLNYVDIPGPMPWESFAIYVRGAKASEHVLSVEIVFNIEAQIILGTLSGAIATAPASHNPRVLTAASHARSTTRNTHKDEPSFLGSLWDAAKRGLSHAASVFGPPILRSVVPRLLGGAPRPLMLSNAPIDVD